MRLSIDHFLLLNDNGAFADYAKTELIDGDIYVMNAQFGRHARAKSRLAMAIGLCLSAIGSDLEAITEVAVHTADDSMPEPDIVLTRYQGDRAVPAETVALIVEVSDTTLDTDLGRKTQLYAAAGVPEYWVVDLNAGRLVMHDGPGADGYRRRRETPLGGRVEAATIAGLEIGTERLSG